MTYRTKTQRQREAYNKMISNNKKYKQELIELVGKGNPDYLSPGKFKKYTYLVRKIENTDITLKYKNTEKQKINKEIIPDTSLGCERKTFDTSLGCERKTFDTSLGCERKTFDTVSESSESVASNRLEEWSDSDTEDILIGT